MTDARPEAFTVATEGSISAFIGSARSRLVVVAPGLSSREADAVVERLLALPAGAITLIVDSDPEVFRLGYGTLEGLQRVQEAAATAGVAIRRQPGIRIGLVIADADTLIYTPTPRLVEAGPNTQGAANAIRLGRPTVALEVDVAGDERRPPSVGRSALSEKEMSAVKADLEANPVQRFDLSRKQRVFNSFIDFVELEVRGTELARKTVALPPHLLAVADQKTREQLETRFRLVPPEDKLSGDAIDKDRKLIARRFLHTIPHFGVVVLSRHREQFLEAVKELESSVERFRLAVEAKIQARIEKNIAELIHALLPALTRRPPAEWTPSSGAKPGRDTVKLFLEEELRQAFGPASAIVKGMEVRCHLKGVTYSMLTDPVFAAAAVKAMPELKRFHREFDAAEGRPVDQALVSQS